MKLNIISPEGTLFEGEVSVASFPSVEGTFEVWPHHAPIIAALGEGQIRYSCPDDIHNMEVKDGFVEVKNDIITVCIEQKGHVQIEK